MRLHEKIHHCRKKAGMSQEVLAEHIGVSRQAISKWENNEAEPEIKKLRKLADVFKVSLDWLVSEADDKEEPAEPDPPTNSSVHHTVDLEAIPGGIGKLFRRYGWIFGVYLAFVGTGLVGMGSLARYMLNRMFHGFGGAPGGEMNPFNGEINDGVSSFASNNPVGIMATFFIVAGIILIISGITFAILQKKRGAGDTC